MAPVRHCAYDLCRTASYFESVIDLEGQLKEQVWEGVSRGEGGLCLYMFRCNTCNRFRSTWDMD